MIELNVGIDEKVRLKFCSATGLSDREYVVDADKLRRAALHEDEIKECKRIIALREEAITELMDERQRLYSQAKKDDAEIRRLQQVCCRPLPPAGGTPLYVIDGALVEELREALRTAKQGPQWRPMSAEAGRNANPILYVTKKEREVKEGWLVRYSTHTPEFIDDEGDSKYWCRSKYGGEDELATHWMPKPAPPTEGE